LADQVLKNVGVMIAGVPLPFVDGAPVPDVSAALVHATLQKRAGVMDRPRHEVRAHTGPAQALYDDGIDACLFWSMPATLPSFLGLVHKKL
jgi:hypothetical protein